MNKLIINSDDYGYSRAINHAIIDTFQEGILTSTTLMTNTPGFEHAVELAKENPELGIGVHLVLTFLKPLRQDVPSLVDAEGNFHGQRKHQRGDVTIDLDELYKEWDTQIQKVLDAGLTLTHLDSHHHVHTYHEGYYNVFLKLAKKYDLPIRKVNYLGIEHDQTTTSYFEPAFDPIGTLPLPEQEAYLADLLKTIKENDSTELMCHTGYMDEFLFKHSSFIEDRLYQVRILTDSDFVDQIKSDPNIVLSTFADL